MITYHIRLARCLSLQTVYNLATTGSLGGVRFFGRGGSGANEPSALILAMQALLISLTDVQPESAMVVTNSSYSRLSAKVTPASPLYCEHQRRAPLKAFLLTARPQMGTRPTQQ